MTRHTLLRALYSRLTPAKDRVLDVWFFIPLLLLILSLQIAPAHADPNGPVQPWIGPAPRLYADYTPKLSPAAVGAYSPVDVKDRAAVVAHFNANYNTTNPPIGWTGNHAACNPGETSAEFKNALIGQINFYRRMAGIQDVALAGSTDNLGAQKAALLMSVNSSLSHDPPTNWTCYPEMTATDPKGSDYAGRSNLFLGTNGAESIHGYIMDPGGSNTAAGHRGWIFWPQRTEIGTGDVPAGSEATQANALYVFGAQSATRQTRDKISGYEVVAWPPPGYVPYQIAYSRWSLEYPGADFSAATVTMTKLGCPNETSIATEIQNRGSRLVWVPTDIVGYNPGGWGAYSKPDADTVYRVTANNATVDGVNVTFSYNVIVIDPATNPGPVTWDGSDSADWNTCQNWSNNRTPLSIDNVTIPAGTPAPVIGNGVAEVDSLIVADSASLHLTGGSLNVYGDWNEEGSGRTTATGGTIHFMGDATQSVVLNGQTTLPNLTVGNGVAVRINGNANIDGNVTILERGSFQADSLNVAGNWDDRNVGNGFIPGTGTVVFDGTAQSIDKLTATTEVDENFNANPIDACSSGLPPGWTRQQAEGHGFLWCGTGNTDTPGVAMRWATTPDGWLFTPALSLSAGVNYQLSYKYEVQYMGNDSFAAYVAAAPTATAMLATPAIHGPVNGSTTAESASAPFTVATDGTYYIGFRSQGSNYAVIDDVKVNGQGRVMFHNLTSAVGTTTFLKDVAVAGNLRVEAGATIALRADSLTVEGSVVNNGGLKQERTVADSTATRFLHIQNQAKTTTKYAGVDITPDSTGLGATWANILGNQTACNSGDELIHRCFDIIPTSAQPATVRFWYLDSEKGAQDSTGINTYHWNGTAWDALTPATPPRGTEGEYTWAEAVNISSYSPFGLSGSLPTGPPVAEIDLFGNGIPIVSGDDTPSGADYTDFGPVVTGGVPVTRTFTIHNTSPNVLFLSGAQPVTVTGSDAFQVVSQPPATIPANGSATFLVRFDPSSTGLLTAQLIIANNDGDENPYTFHVQGAGLTSIYLPAVQR